MTELKRWNKLNMRWFAKKQWRQNRWSNSPMENIKYGVMIPHCIKKTLQYDDANSNDIWKILSEISALMQ